MEDIPRFSGLLVRGADKTDTKKCNYTEKWWHIIPYAYGYEIKNMSDVSMLDTERYKPIEDYDIIIRSNTLNVELDCIQIIVGISGEEAKPNYHFISWDEINQIMDMYDLDVFSPTKQNYDPNNRFAMIVRNAYKTFKEKERQKNNIVCRII